MWSRLVPGMLISYTKTAQNQCTILRWSVLCDSFFFPFIFERSFMIVQCTKFDHKSNTKLCNIVQFYNFKKDNIMNKWRYKRVHFLFCGGCGVVVVVRGGGGVGIFSNSWTHKSDIHRLSSIWSLWLPLSFFTSIFIHLFLRFLIRNRLCAL